MKVLPSLLAKPISLDKINDFVERLLDIMNAEFDPEVVSVKVDPAAKLASCFFNVEEKIKCDVGEIHYGWVIWQHSHIIEADIMLFGKMMKKIGNDIL